MLGMAGIEVALLGIAMAVVLSGIGSAWGIGLTGQAAAGVLSEDPTKFGRLLPLVGLPGTQGIYGFLIALLAAMKLGFIDGKLPDLTPDQGLKWFLVCQPVAWACLVSAIWQGKVCVSAIQLTAKKATESARGLILGVFVEFYAVLGFVASVLLWVGAPDPKFLGQ
ncbi:MAG: V-type ATP synthase subunit K [Planctomycetota bacterium]|nr:V-type ATP synthase subunit K [Planctomycetota bacterium]